MWRAVCLAFTLCLVGPALAACGGNEFKVGPTTVVLQHDVEPWRDLPEALHAMQTSTTTPEPYVHPMWDTTIILEPAYRPVYQPGTGCYFNQITNQIVARVLFPDEPTVHDCLPHELAHRWHYVDDPDGAQADPHGDDWHALHLLLQAAAANTWLAR